MWFLEMYCQHTETQVVGMNRGGGPHLDITMTDSIHILWPVLNHKEMDVLNVAEDYIMLPILLCAHLYM